MLRPPQHESVPSKVSSNTAPRAVTDLVRSPTNECQNSEGSRVAFYEETEEDDLDIMDSPMVSLVAAPTPPNTPTRLLKPWQPELTIDTSFNSAVDIYTSTFPDEDADEDGYNDGTDWEDGFNWSGTAVHRSPILLNQTFSAIVSELVDRAGRTPSPERIISELGRLANSSLFLLGILPGWLTQKRYPSTVRSLIMKPPPQVRFVLVHHISSPDHAHLLLSSELALLHSDCRRSLICPSSQVPNMEPDRGPPLESAGKILNRLGIALRNLGQRLHKKASSVRSSSSSDHSK